MGILRDCFWEATDWKSKLAVDSLCPNASSSPFAMNFLDQRSNQGGAQCIQPSSRVHNPYIGKTTCENGDSGWFSSSLPDIFSHKLSFAAQDTAVGGQSVNNPVTQLTDDEYLKSFEELESYTIKNLLPDDDDLFSGVIDEANSACHTNNRVDDLEEFDLFSSGGGLELDAESCDSSNVPSNNKYLDLLEFSTSLHSGTKLPLMGEHPCGEHPSRTLFVRNINSNIEDRELLALFEQYGAIRSIQTTSKHRGFIIVSYYDIRAARSAMRALQNKPLRRCKLDIHFSYPKDNTSDRDINQGTLVVFNLDPSVSNDDLKQIFGVYGEVKEIRETPHKRHHKFIEFYDVRAADAALKALNRSDIAGKRIKLEPSRPGGARRCLTQQLFQDLEHEGCCNIWQNGVSPVYFAGSDFSKGVSGNLHDMRGTEGLSTAKSVPQNIFPEKLLHKVSSSDLQTFTARGISITKPFTQSLQRESTYLMSCTNPEINPMASCDVHFPHDFNNNSLSSLQYNSSTSVSSINARSLESVQNRHIHGVQHIFPNNTKLDHKPHGFSLPGHGAIFNAHNNKKGNSSFHGNQFGWSSPKSYGSAQNSMLWTKSSSYAHGTPTKSLTQFEGCLFPSSDGNRVSATLGLQNYAGSAPILGPISDRGHLQVRDSMEASLFHAASFGSNIINSTQMPTPFHLRNPTFMARSNASAVMDSMASSPSSGATSLQKKTSAFSSNASVLSTKGSHDNSNERGRSRRSDNSNQVDNKKQFALNIDKILSGEDTRTTLMIKNIPNKYTSKMLLSTIDEHHHGTYDFIYLPIDFKNKCNVGYSFINMIDPLHIVSFYKAFNGKKWEKFNSEKVASLAYARIQGKAALIAHFQNSSLMNEDKRCRPIIFHTDGPNAGDQEPFPVGFNVRTRPGKNRSSNFGSPQGSPSNCENGEESSNGSESSRSPEKG